MMVRAFEALHPGGWIKVHDIVFPSKVEKGSGTNTLDDWANKLISFGEGRGQDRLCTKKYEQYMKDVGFVVTSVAGRR